MTTGLSSTQTVDLTNCDREPIHILGRVQPFGFLVAVGSDWLVSRVSRNLDRFTGRSPDAVLGQPLSALFAEEAIHAIRNRMTLMTGPDSVERIFALPLLCDANPLFGRERFDVAIHRSGRAVVIEAEWSATDGADAAGLVRTMVARLGRADSVTALLREGARQVRALTGFDRVMVYRYNEEGSGEVAAEALATGVDSFLGLHYPASDVPAQARALYLRNTFRVIADIAAEPVPIEPELDPAGQPLDLSLSLLRAVSPIHIEYLRNMGVRASLSISIVVGGKLWGLFACHHYAPRTPNLATRTAAELYGQMFSLVLESRERTESAQYEAQARALTDRLMTAIAQESDLLANAGWLGEMILETIPADGAAVVLRGDVVTTGLAPRDHQVLELVNVLNRTAASEVFATDSIRSLLPEAADWGEGTAGLIAIPLSRSPRDYVMLFRGEQARSVRWAGNPLKPVQLGPNGDRLTPRKSFEAWTEHVRGRSKPFTASERRVAEAVRIAMLEVLVRMADVVDSERQRAGERQELLIAELNHRVRNILALIRGLISQTRDGAASLDDFIDNLDGRIQALARAHDQVTKDQWGPIRLTDLIEIEIHAYLGAAQDRVTFTGPNVLIDQLAFTTLALVFHELLTNAVKYGALSDSGQVRIAWQTDRQGDLQIEWTELGGPAVRAPARRGFGSTIIERSIPHDLHGRAEVAYKLGGLAARFCVPARHVVEVSAPPAPARAAKPASAPVRPLAGKTVLLVEDSMIIALDAEDAVRSLGAHDVQLASSVRSARMVIEKQPIDLALLDFNLGPETSAGIALDLEARGVPYLFTTGYGESISDLGFPHVRVLTKPYKASQIAEAVAEMVKG